jgi:ubiquinone/menaquinone biosynthesis C-methylase UbiE
MTTSSYLDKQIEKEFHNFLLEKMKTQGYSAQRQISWAKYMMDYTRPDKIISDFITKVGWNDITAKSALDIGCGFGGLLLSMQPHFESIYGIDIDKLYVEWAKKRNPSAEVIWGDANQLPWSDNSFDLVCATDVFEHINYLSQENVANEIMRVLKPGGYGIIIVPNKLQILDEHNKVLFGTWLPPSKRKNYVQIFSNNSHYDQCWERTGRGWKNLFSNQRFEVIHFKPHFMKGLNFLKYVILIPANRYQIYIRKPL